MPTTKYSLTPIRTLVEGFEPVPEIHRRILKELGKIENEMSQHPQDGATWIQLFVAQDVLAWVENPDGAGPPTQSIERLRQGQS